MNRTTWIGGPLFASIAAGPVFTLALGLTMMAATPGYGTPLVGMGLIFVLGMPVGFLLALIPNIAGAALLAWSGTTWPTARHPMAWAMTGGAFGWLIGATVIGSLFAIPMAVTGIACALICRLLVVWPD